MSTDGPQIFVSGTWRESFAAPFAGEGAKVGTLIARAGYHLACGPGTGMARHVVDGYRSVDGRAGRVRFYLPAQHYMEAVQEAIGDGYDDLIPSEHDYPMRNVWQVSLSSGLIAITGGDGTLEEILPALIDYRIPVGVLRGSGPAAAAVEALLPIFPDWVDSLFLGDDAETVARHVLDRVAATSAA